MFEKVNPSHPDKLADRIAGAIVDLAYTKCENPIVACEVLIGHNHCFIINETSLIFLKSEIDNIVHRIADPRMIVYYHEYMQDMSLHENQEDGIHCGDNGIFKGVPLTTEEKNLTEIADQLYNTYSCDGKYVLDDGKLIICHSRLLADEEDAIVDYYSKYYNEVIINPLGYWTGGTDVDCGATNRKLGSDMGCSVTGGGLHGKDLSKADVSVNIYCWLEAQRTGKTIEYSCAIGDDKIGYLPYSKISEIAKEYIDSIGGFEKLAEWGLIRP